MYVIRLTATTGGSFSKAIAKTQEDVTDKSLFIRYWGRPSNAGWAHGIVKVKHSHKDQARTWATAESAQAVADRFTDDYHTYTVEEA